MNEFEGSQVQKPISRKKRETNEKHEANMAVIRSSGIPFKESTKGVVIFSVVSDGWPCSAVFYTTKNRLVVNSIKYDEHLNVHDVLEWVKARQPKVADPETTSAPAGATE